MNKFGLTLVSTNIRMVSSWVNEDQDIVQQCEEVILPQIDLTAGIIFVVLPNLPILAATLMALLSRYQVICVAMQYRHNHDPNYMAFEFQFGQ